MPDQAKTFDPATRAVIADAFAGAPFVNDVGIAMLDCGPGWCEASLVLESRHLQHTGVVHAGAQATIADHTAGAAAITLVPAGYHVLTAEFKLNLLRPARGESLWSRAEVLKPGKNIMVVESEVYSVDGDKRVLVSKLTATLAVIAPK
jgi:uncharacterized protein (TIGR00369 family)